jgi:hypothetical protein
VDSQLEEKKREKKRKGKERKKKNTHPPPHTQRLRSNSVKKLRLKLMDQTEKESIRYRNQPTKSSADVMRHNTDPEKNTRAEQSRAEEGNKTDQKSVPKTAEQ